MKKCRKGESAILPPRAPGSFNRLLDGAARRDPTWARDQLATAVGADVDHRRRASGAEGAFIGADKRGTFRLEGGPAPFTPGSHLECHWEFIS